MGRRLTLTRSNKALANILKKGGKYAEGVIDNLRATGNIKRINTLTKMLNKDFDLFDTRHVEELVSSLSLLQDAILALK